MVKFHLINNAGIAVSKSSLKTSIEDWDNVNTNLRGFLFVLKYLQII